MAKITPIDILKIVSSKYSLVTGLLYAKHTLLAKQTYFSPREETCPQYTTWDMLPYRPLKTAVRPKQNNKSMCFKKLSITLHNNNTK